MDRQTHAAEDEEATGGFPLAPASWYCVGSVADVSRGPRRFSLPGGQGFVAFRGPGGVPAVLNGRCCHLGADLSLGCVRDGRVACPLHGWEFAPDGRCEHIPASADIPVWARQASYPTAVCGGQLFFFNRTVARFPFPFFRDVDEGSLLASRPFEFTVDAPWYLVSGNGFDTQHFLCAHDRTLVAEPTFDAPSLFSRRLRATFRVTGDSPRDRLTRLFSGPEVAMDVESWGGNLVLVTARFRCAVSYGTVSIIPLDEHRTLVRNFVWVPRSRGSVARWLLDPLRAAVRRFFIREFVRADVAPVTGIRYQPRRMIAADKVLADYLLWLQTLHRQPSTELP